jgi:two-component system sensor histidine kinase HydH
VESLRGLLKFDLEHKDAELEAQLDVPLVHADPDALRQVLLNLLANSMDALPDTGGEVRLIATRGQGGVWLAVEDNGPGMPEEVKTQAFEPFFTAKQGGTGLGLAIVQTIVRGHHGAVRIDTEPGQGTAVRLFFPDGGPHPDADYLQGKADREREHEEGEA